jgi:hypothetical protein
MTLARCVCVGQVHLLQSITHELNHIITTLSLNIKEKKTKRDKNRKTTIEYQNLHKFHIDIVKFCSYFID